MLVYYVTYLQTHVQYKLEGIATIYYCITQIYCD